MSAKLRAAIRYAWIYTLWLSGALWWARRRVRARGAAIVLTLHRVLDDAEFQESSSLPGILIRQRTFDQFLAWASAQCEILDLGRGIPDWRVPAPRPRIALTFDDGWLDNHRFAQPVAARHSASMTIFICPGLTGQRYPFWPERVTCLLRTLGGPRAAADLVDGIPADPSIEEIIERLKTLDPAARQRIIDRLEHLAGSAAAQAAPEPTNQAMTWAQVLELRERSVRFGSHTVNHVILTQVPVEDARDELRQSRASIEQQFQAPCELFAYPNGNYNPEVREAVAGAGYSLAFTTKPGQWTRETDPLLIPRINLSENHLACRGGTFSPAVFQYATFWRCR